MQGSKLFLKADRILVNTWHCSEKHLILLMLGTRLSHKTMVDSTCNVASTFFSYTLLSKSTTDMMFSDEKRSLDEVYICIQ